MDRGEDERCFLFCVSTRASMERVSVRLGWCVTWNPLENNNDLD